MHYYIYKKFAKKFFKQKMKHLSYRKQNVYTMRIIYKWKISINFTSS